MEGKLTKDEFGYWLDISDDGITKSPLNDFGQLSIKNCQSIENGYDLDELSKSYAIRDDISDEFDYVDGIMKHFKAGLQKAFEIKSDKNFSEEDVRKAIDIAWRNEESNKIDIIQSIKKTEWDVEICCYVDNSNGWLDADSFNSPLLTNTGIPKLDSDGFLILKRI
jgi:hypothetical protein